MEKDILLIDKPKGITSFDVIRKLRKKLGVQKMGHSGTLDPLASGLLIIGIGKGTKKLTKFLKLPKIYEAEIVLGIKTDTGDMAGKIMNEEKIIVENGLLKFNNKKLSPEKIKEILKKITGKLNLPVPLYSAVKISGKPLYKLVRKGINVKPPKKEMEIFWIKLKESFKFKNYYILKVEMKVSSGTYVRSIAEEIGKRIGVPASVKELRRTQIGKFKVSQAEKIE